MKIYKEVIWIDTNNDPSTVLSKKNKIFSIIILFCFFFGSSLPINTLNSIKTDSESSNKKIKVEQEITEVFASEIGGNTYLTEYITEDDIADAKETMSMLSFAESNVIIDGHGTGLIAPTDREMDLLIGKKMIKSTAISYSKMPNAMTTYDFSNQTYFPEVRSQGSQGSCAAWAMTYYNFGYLEAKDYGWDASSGNTEYLMSPAWTYNKATPTGYGSWMSSNAQIIKDFGCTTWSTMPYDDSDYLNWGNEAQWRAAPQHQLYDYYLMDFEEDNPENTIDLIKSTISTDTPVNFAFDAGFYSPGFSDGNYILSAEEYESDTLTHAQTIVGFNDSITDDGEVGAFKVVNSWGSGFADDGFYWITYDCLIEIGFSLSDFGIHLCVVTDLEDYQPELIATWEFEEAPVRMDDLITVGVGPYGTPLNSTTPWYDFDQYIVLPDFMTMDISEFLPYYTADNDEQFFLEVGSSASEGIISSFIIERYADGSFIESTLESINVPKATPGYVVSTFKIVDHETWVTLNIPDFPVFGEEYLIEVNVENLGSHSESDIYFNLYIDDVVVNHTSIAIFDPDMILNLTYRWTPDEYRDFNITATSTLVSEDAFPTNNEIQILLTVFSWENYVMRTDTPYHWVDASGGTLLELDDDDFAHVTLPFEFTFYQQNFTEIYVSSNGYLSFYDVTPDEYENLPFPSEAEELRYIIAPFWGDLYPQFSGTISVQGFSDYWVVEWVDINYSDPDQNVFDNCSFQAILYENGDIAFNYDYFTLTTEVDYTCGLNLGLNTDYYNEYSGLESTTDNFTLYFEAPVAPESIQLSDTAEIPDDDGDFDLTWSVEGRSNNFTVYQYANMITEINASLAVIGEDILSLSYEIRDYADGIYYFVVAACNDFGVVISNCIKITVLHPTIPGDFSLSTDSDSPDQDGSFNLSWEAAAQADNYSVYQYSNEITEINTSLTLLAEEILDLTFSITDLLDGTYYFVVIAQNELGVKFSDNLLVEVEHPSDPILPGAFTLDSDADSPDKDGNITLDWTTSSDAISYSLYQSTSMITDINGSLTVIATDLTTQTALIEDLPTGNYYFVVVASNADGDTLSNVVHVEVSRNTSGIPGFGIGMFIVLLFGTSFYLYKRRFKHVI